ncbi:MAG TPA: hypothetical protein DEE98_04840 [Elusimicrobia bacterium]|nr:MAG: hypothetical protein A2278_04525 [Elusimicrobia bacterium RIFOXYA12_FULL_49_49]OGS09301.1 MAG: hypothetical protein A2204_06755 [Elusimicrobia bacterium RIFOXYA1_FULL_47_7]OGS14689.1 MAG: hypothetical protein A2251_09315 [Elusimicrobia bacterium RIFOXYA2_FULL_47_53]OGS25659.1 MAG: hypothetical protein A2339_06275 [Elusimicrobia bacterium RIFOXYB12_FULL_50_12]OGS31780.1 MAG: hypothetical protein A2323_06225 [Elusimicrobia bacterium RIFOXYB2_FULL_46_23]HBU69690.1 hypothetical protein [El
MLKKVLVRVAVVLGVLILGAGGFAGWFFYQVREMHPLETGKISDSVYAIKGDMGNMFIVKNKDVYIAFDASDNVGKIKSGCESLSIDPNLVRAVFLTHSDADHVDGLPAFPNAKVYISKDEEPLLKEKTHRHFMGMAHMNKLPVSEYITLSDGDSVNVDGITVNAVSTPGHTLGSMCYRVGDALFVGDLCMIVNDTVRPMIKIFTEDMATDAESIKKIAKLNNFSRIYTAHSGYTRDLEKALKDWR